MTKTRVLFLLATAVLVASCTPTAAPPPAVTPQGEDAFLIDPRAGYGAPIPPMLDQQLEAAWRFFLAGDEAEARRRTLAIRTKQPDFAPAALLEAALDIRAGRFDSAQALIDQVKRRTPDYLAARVYEAEILFRDRQTRRAYEAYRALAADPNAPPTARQRLTELETAMFNEVFAAAQSVSDATQSVQLLREALAFQPTAIEPRIMLAQRLVSMRQFEDARREIDPVLNSSADRPEVQEVLAEVEVGRGRYQEAIVRYDRLARRTKDPRYAQRLEVIKEEFSMANMPPQYRQALESPALTRADLAVLLYWTVPSVRFAQNLGAPPIAIDIENVSGREEIIRAIAIGLYDVDPVTRRVSPSRPINAERLSRHLARLLVLRGGACARGVPLDRVLATCGVADPAVTFGPDAVVTGRDAAKLLEPIAKALQ